MKEHGHRYVAVIEKHTLQGANTITLMKHKQKYVVLANSTRMDGANTAAIMFSIVAWHCGEYQVYRLIKCMGSGRLRMSY